MIAVRGLAKYYGAYQAIAALDFSIARGEIVGLIGLNGAGKSTVLKILGAFLVPSAGYAEVAGCSIADDPQGVRRAIGFLPDSPPLYREMSVDAYLEYVLRLKVGHLSRADLQRQRDEALDRTTLTAERSRTLGELSHGFAQRVGIAQAIIHKPPVLILDEPINGLDPVQIVEMRDLILSFRHEHTVILSSHILSEITPHLRSYSHSRSRPARRTRHRSRTGRVNAQQHGTAGGDHTRPAGRGGRAKENRGREQGYLPTCSKRCLCSNIASECRCASTGGTGVGCL